MSGSTSSSDFNNQLAFLRSIVDSVAVSATTGARFVIFGFDHNTNSLASSFTDREARWRDLIKQQINSIRLTAGATTINKAITQAKEFLNTTSRSVPRVVVFLTDGGNYGGPESLRQPAEELRTVSIINNKLFSSILSDCRDCFQSCPLTEPLYSSYLSCEITLMQNKSTRPSVNKIPAVVLWSFICLYMDEALVCKSALAGTMPRSFLVI